MAEKECLIEIKAELLQDYIDAVDSNNGRKATYIKGKLDMLDQILKEVI